MVPTRLAEAARACPRAEGMLRGVGRKLKGLDSGLTVNQWQSWAQDLEVRTPHCCSKLHSPTVALPAPLLPAETTASPCSGTRCCLPWEEGQALPPPHAAATPPRAMNQTCQVP